MLKSREAVMPMLQVDGKDIAEIDDVTAAALSNLASVGLGKLRLPPTVKSRVGEPLQAASIVYDIWITFPLRS
jgi:hypothetical protein